MVEKLLLAIDKQRYIPNVKISQILLHHPIKVLHLSYLKFKIQDVVLFRLDVPLLPFAVAFRGLGRVVTGDTPVE